MYIDILCLAYTKLTTAFTVEEVTHKVESIKVCGNDVARNAESFK